MHQSFSSRSAVAGALLISIVGCGPTYTALEPGSTMPALSVAGWTNDVAPDDLLGNVVVVEAFATW